MADYWVSRLWRGLRLPDRGLVYQRTTGLFLDPQRVGQVSEDGLEWRAVTSEEREALQAVVDRGNLIVYANATARVDHDLARIGDARAYA